jgi:hypothetical protein
MMLSGFAGRFGAGVIAAAWLSIRVWPACRAGTPVGLPAPKGSAVRLLQQ